MTVPAELTRSTPRPVSLTRQGWTNILAFCLNAMLVVTVGAYLYSEARNSDRLSPLDWTPRAAAGLIAAAVFGIIRFRRQSRLLMYGRPTLARAISDITPWWYRLRPARSRPRRLQCEFRMLNGGTCRPTVETRDRALGVNSEIVVLYDPDEPEKAVLYPTPALTVRAQ